mmetsp:Transcript_39821/g.124452  ORF Transcript_39821/g.124452 Transcript_39821/m.124452 type:complete len:567 (-) Transcript_39821:1304-3004(-)
MLVHILVVVVVAVVVIISVFVAGAGVVGLALSVLFVAATLRFCSGVLDAFSRSRCYSSIGRRCRCLADSAIIGEAQRACSLLDRLHRSVRRIRRRFRYESGAVACLRRCPLRHCGYSSGPIRGTAIPRHQVRRQRLSDAAHVEIVVEVRLRRADGLCDADQHKSFGRLAAHELDGVVQQVDHEVPHPLREVPIVVGRGAAARQGHRTLHASPPRGELGLLRDRVQEGGGGPERQTRRHRQRPRRHRLDKRGPQGVFRPEGFEVPFIIALPIPKAAKAEAHGAKPDAEPDLRAQLRTEVRLGPQVQARARVHEEVVLQREGSPPRRVDALLAAEANKRPRRQGGNGSIANLLIIIEELLAHQGHHGIVHLLDLCGVLPEVAPRRRRGDPHEGPCESDAHNDVPIRRDLCSGREQRLHQLQPARPNDSLIDGAVRRHRELGEYLREARQIRGGRRAHLSRAVLQERRQEVHDHRTPVVPKTSAERVALPSDGRAHRPGQVLRQRRGDGEELAPEQVELPPVDRDGLGAQTQANVRQRPERLARAHPPLTRLRSRLRLLLGLLRRRRGL